MVEGSIEEERPLPSWHSSAASKEKPARKRRNSLPSSPSPGLERKTTRRHRPHKPAAPSMGKPMGGRPTGVARPYNLKRRSTKGRSTKVNNPFCVEEFDDKENKAGSSLPENAGEELDAKRNKKFNGMYLLICSIQRLAPEIICT